MSLSGEELRARLQRTLDYCGPTHRIDDVVDMCRNGEAQFWSNGDGCIVTQIETAPLVKSVHYWLIWGELRHCLALEHEINPWAIEHGATIATAAGRRGWGRVAAPTGWRPHVVTFWKPLVGRA
jgi:hypothetical protein